MCDKEIEEVAYCQDDMVGIITSTDPGVGDIFQIIIQSNRLAGLNPFRPD